MLDLVLASRFLAALGAGLVAGLFFAFSVSVMAGLGRLPPAEGASAMQAINRAILNPLFAIVFFGTALLCLALLAALFFAERDAGAPYALAGGALYLIGAIVVTMTLNVPMNNALNVSDPSSESGRRLWADYLSRWTFWNHVRTMSSTAAMALLIASIRLAPT